METGLAGDKRAIRDKRMSPALGLRPCLSEGCAEHAVWHQIQLMDVGGSHCLRPVTSPPLTAAFQSWAQPSFNTLQVSLSQGSQECGSGGMALGWCLC